jgi:hypothetical protein
MSCKKEVIGPKGDKGVAGGQGNLIQTHRVFTLSSNAWTSNLGVWWAKVYAPEITNEVINKGEVRVYMKVNNAWWSCPYAVGNLFMEQEIEQGYLNLKYSHIHGDPPPAPIATEFKLVVYKPV